MGVLGFGRIANFIDGVERAPSTDDYRTILAPATGVHIGELGWSSAADVEQACAAAVAAAPAWAALDMPARRDLLLAWGDAVGEVAEDIALADAVDSGTPVRNMRVGVSKGLAYLRYFCGLWSEVKGETIPASSSHLHLTRREPFGPVGIIIPFNHPTLFALSKTVPALLTGNTVVLKPSELTPVSVSLIAKAASRVLPPGVFNVVHGGPDVGAAMVGSRTLRRLHFTGGVSTGLRVQRGAADSGLVKQVSLELGGKNPLIVFADVDPVVAARAAVLGMNYTRNQGQSCGSTSRLFVHSDIAADVTDLICEMVGQIQVGLPEDEATEMGSLISTEHQRRVLHAVSDGRASGARVLAGGTAAGGSLARGAYVLPTVMDRVPPDGDLARTEIFGPVLSIMKWDDPAEMLEQVNATDYGLTAAIYTNDLNQAMGAVRDVHAGYVWVNAIETRWPSTPFGGYKNSGVGSEHSLDELLSYTQLKAVNIAFPSL